MPIQNFNDLGANQTVMPEEKDCEFIKGVFAGSNLEDASRSLKAISHPLRLNILCVLGSGEMGVQEILEKVGTTQSNVSQHLCLLKDKGIVSSRKDANRVFYTINNETVKMILGGLDTGLNNSKEISGAA